MSIVHSGLTTEFFYSDLDRLIVSPCSWRQVGFVQYSDDARTEFRLNTYSDKGTALAAVHLITYKGGNTKTGAVILSYAITL